MDYRIYFPILDRYGGPVLLVVFLLLLFLQHKWPLRRWVKSLSRRFLVNIGVTIPTFLVLRLVLIPAQVGIAYWATEHRIGLLNFFAPPSWLHGVATFLLLDYLLYVWHRLSHRVPFIWRFHNVHHTDLNLGVTTALRFHFGEMLLSGLFRVAGVLLIGAEPVAVLVYEVVFEASVAFHHSNWRLPYGLERVLSTVVVTPRMHGIHHSIVQQETDSNYSSLLNVWDRMHGTMRLNVRQEDIVVGVPAYHDDGYDQTVFGLLTLPFRRQKAYWKRPDGTQPDREEQGGRTLLQP